MDYDSESATGHGPSSMQGLLMQNTELRRKLEEQNESYKSKLAAYQEGQSKQTEIVKKLQQKVCHSLNVYYQIEILQVLCNWLKLWFFY